MPIGRRALDLGEIGEVVCTPQVQDESGRWVKTDRAGKAKRWEARAYFRGFDGVRRDVRVTARRRPEAEAALHGRVSERLRGAGDGELTSNMSMTLAGEWFVRQIERSDSGLSARTVQDYSAAWRRYVVAEGSPIRGLTLEQVNDPQRLTAFLRRVADRHGNGASKMARSTLAGLLRYAVDAGVLTTNAMRQVRATRSQTPRESERDHERAFTRAERDAVLAHVDAQVPGPETEKANPRSVRKAQAVADLTAFLAGTGARIDEARRTLWSSVDLNAGTAYIDGTKSGTSSRTVNLPTWLTARLERRRVQTGGEGYLFASPASHDSTVPWDQSNSARAVRAALDGAGLKWAVPHTFRRTVATLLHEAGVPIVRIADQLGHADPSLTARVYLGRDFAGDKAELAAVL